MILFIIDIVCDINTCETDKITRRTCRQTFFLRPLCLRGCSLQACWFVGLSADYTKTTEQISTKLGCRIQTC